MTRLPTHLLVAALLRRVNDAGGIAVVRARGDASGGAVLVLLEREGRAVERGLAPDGSPALIDSRAENATEPLDGYWRRRRLRDPDLWVIELSAPDAESVTREALL